MRMQHRNRQKFKYCYYLGKEPVYDDDGNFTGEYESKYSKPKTGWANINSGYISANHMSGTAAPMTYGMDIDYIKTVMAPTDFGMDEKSMLWIDDLKADKPDYVIRRIGKSLNNVRIACTHVDITNDMAAIANSIISGGGA